MTAPEPTLPAYADVQDAAQRLTGVAHLTPVQTCRTFDSRTGAHVYFKCENFQRAGAFKFRGAYNAISRLDKEQCAKGVLAFSSGNHAQAVALACSILNIKSVIVMPNDAPKVKLEATRAYGAEVVLYDPSETARENMGRELAAKRGLTVIPPFDHPHVIAGQGTCAKELFDDVGPLDMLVVCVGGGGLISGCALAAKRLSPNCRVVGVEPEAGDDGVQSFKSGKIVEIPTPQTIADGARTNRLGDLTFPIIREKVDDMLTVSDGALVRTMRFLWERMKIVVEPTGALAAAALLEGKVEAKGKSVGAIISGGNVDLTRAMELFEKYR